MIADLHCHTTASDGELSPAEIVERAVAAKIDLLAITDHDTIKGYLKAKPVAEERSIRLLPGVEYSSLWRRMNIHVVGLGIEVDHPVTQRAMAFYELARRERAEVIATKLVKAGLPDILQGVTELAGESQLGRPHFARYMVEQGLVPSFERAFDRYLGTGKPGDVKAHWPELAEVVGWIKDAGGVAVLAHPLHYKMTRTKLRELMAEFAAVGGQAVEVVSGKQRLDWIQQMAALAEKFGLYASIGSDYHGPKTPWCELGCSPPLPRSCRPVWQLLGAEQQNDQGV